MRRLLRDLDGILLGTTILLIAVGLVVLASATASLGGPGPYLKTRLFHLAVAAVAMVAVMAVDYRRLAASGRVLYLGNLALLGAVLVVGVTRLGAQRWIPLGPFGGFQPSELAKIALILTLARHLADRTPPASVPAFVPYLAHAGIPILLIVAQPDLGTAMVIGAILLGMLFLAGARLGALGGLGGLALMGAPFLWSVLHDYQQRRLLVFLDPGIDPLGAGYAVTQAKIAVGSGQLWGKGLFAGTQNLLRFIPEQHTDFIFTVIGEELGFVGAVCVLALFLIWIWRALRIGATASDRLGRLIAGGIAAMVVFHVFVSVGMTVGLMPITGIPLPFLSYGGSSLLAMSMATGLLLNIGMRRRRILF
ncbi:MAG: rod shape-determining protein RodA [Armatimonadetes bacterium]|nr:rod shape-determining protein RodA [Armatimonadota bacterium]